MAITVNGCPLLFYSKKIGVNYDETLTLGRQNLYASLKNIEDCIRKYNNNEKNIHEVKFVDEYSEPLFEILGAKTIESIDFSLYENATIIHDLNLPIPDSLKNRFTAIVDGGTIEHIFNFPVAIKNCMNALKIGGHYIGITPANNQMGHGFYQFSPELYFRIFSDVNGFKVKKMMINNSEGYDTFWYDVLDPKVVNSRVTLGGGLAINLIIIAEKISEKDIFNTIPQQIDYVNTWDAHKTEVEKKVINNESKLKFLYRKIIPKKIKKVLKNIFYTVTVKNTEDAFIGKFNSKHFKKIDI